MTRIVAGTKALAADYAALLGSIAKGEIPVYVIGRTWDETYAGDVHFTADGWEFVLFNDCDSLDYTDWVKAPDGQKADFADLSDGACDPICYTPLRDTFDVELLETRLKRAHNDYSQIS